MLPMLPLLMNLIFGAENVFMSTYIAQMLMIKVTMPYIQWARRRTKRTNRSSNKLLTDFATMKYE